MDLKQWVMLALLVSVITTVFGFGLRATAIDALYLVMRPGLLGRTLLAMFVVMPLVAVALARAFDCSPTVRIALVALSIAPIPPLLPKKLSKAGGRPAYAIGLMVTLGLLAIVIVPMAAALIGRLLDRPFAMSVGGIAGVILKTTLLPLIAGMALCAISPAIAGRVEKPISLIGKVLLPIAIIALVSRSLPAVWALVGSGNVVAITVFVIAGLVAGHFFGAPDRDHRVVLALSTACRHPVIALSIAAANFPEERFGATILLYLILSALIGIPYQVWQKRHAAVESGGEKSRISMK